MEGEIMEPMPQSIPAKEDFDSETMRATKPGLKRLILSLSVLFSFLLGLPFLWKSVEIYRSPLPFAGIDALSRDVASNPLLFPCQFQAVFFSPSPEMAAELDSVQLRSSLVDEMTKLLPQKPQCGSCLRDFSLSVVVDPFGPSANGCRISGSSSTYSCGAIKDIEFDSGDEHKLDDALESILGDKMVYTVVIAVTRDVKSNAWVERVVVGKHRHAWLVTRKDSKLERMIAEIFVNVFVHGGNEEGSMNVGFIPVGADGRIVLSFNLLNADPRDWVYDWNFQSAEDTLLLPIVKALSPIANISIESQVLYHTPKSSFSSWNEKLRSHVFQIKDLPFFVNANEWHLDTSIAAGGRSKILQFVVYIPSSKECPLNLQLSNGKLSSTNGFISPMWGGVVVWNHYDCSGIFKDRQSLRNVLSSEDLQKVLEVFVGQLRQLLGLKPSMSYFGSSGKFRLLTSHSGFTHWEVDFLSRQHTCFNLHSSATTLGSLSRLVKSLPRMIIMDEIGRQVKVSLEAAKRALKSASLGAFDESAASSRQARSLAEDAFYHPSIMSVSYYSFEHCFAVYSPFFLPVTMHVILAAVREWKRYKKQQAKYLLWKGISNPPRH